MTLRPHIASALLVTACASTDEVELPPLVFESEHAILGVHADLGGMLCRADLAYVDAQIERVEAQLGVRRETTVAVRLVPFTIIDEVCGADSGACYDPSEDVIYSRWHSLGHELVHAVARDLEFPSLFWSEGAAEALSGSTLRDDRITLEPDDLEAQSLSTYRSAGHFSRFLIETWGWEDYRRAIRGDAIEDVYARSAAELTAEYERSAPYAFPPLDPCPHPRIPRVDETSWGTRVDFSCESANATAFGGGSWGEGASVDLAIELSAGTYDFLLEGGERMYAIACHTDVLFTESSPPSNGDLYNQVDLAAALPFEAGKVHRLELTDGTYLVSISSDTYGLVSAEVSITRVE